MENKNNIWIWVVVGIIVIAVVVYLALTGGIPTTQKKEGIKTDQGTVAAPGASAVTEEGVVLNARGEEAKNDVVPGSPEAPQQSNPISVEEVPSSAVKVSVSSSGFLPAELSVNKGQPVTISVTSVDNQTHVFAFKDPLLQAVAVGVAPGETRVLTFNAPTKAGEYVFFCNVPGHEARGEVGKMIVK